MKIYIHKDTGVATAALSDTTPLATLTGVLGATYHLDCVFHDGTAPVELASGASGVLIVKQDKHFTDPVIFGALSWTKFSAPGDGYRFTTVPAGDALLTLLSNLDTIPLMAFIAFLNGGDLLITQKISFVVRNSGYRVDETVPPLLPSVWPAPDTIALKTDIQPAIVAFMTPGNLTVPTISANQRVDQLFEATPGTWTKNPTAFAYQWFHSANGTDWTLIGGATVASFTPGNDLVGKHLRVGVVASNAFESSVSAYSVASVALAAAEAPSNDPTPYALPATWHLDEESGVRGDATGNGFDLTDNNGVGYTAGYSGNAAYSDGGKWLSTSKAFDLSGDFTISIMGQGFSGGQMFVGQHGAGLNPISVWCNGGSIQFGCDQLDATVMGTVDFISDGGWHTVTIQRRSGVVTAYADGVQTVDTEGTPFSVADGRDFSGRLGLFCDPDGAFIGDGYAFIGGLDEASVSIP